MHDPEFFRAISIVIFVGTTAFIGVFLLEPWYRTNFGRSLMIMAVAVWLFSITSMLTRWFGTDYWGYAEIRLAANVLIACAIWSRLNSLVEARRAFRLADLDQQERETT